ncbi:hypothetical protein, partial [Dactylosporangium siamense]|uniref:hypothetical protein n=1 Tax=Dactylosporangium siamense TaxID=685454 RepID=UPI0019422A2E
MSSFDDVQYVGDRCAHDVHAGLQYVSHGTSGHAVHVPPEEIHRFDTPNCTFIGALEDPSDPARVPYSIRSRVTVMSYG